MGLREAKLRTFMVGDRLFDVEMNLPPGGIDAPVTYCIDWAGTMKLIFNAPDIGMHHPVLLAALDVLEQNNELDEEVATTPLHQIAEI